MTALNALKLSRAADREALFAALAATAATHGAEVERFDHDRHIHATIRLNGALASIGIDHDRAWPTPIISWVAPREPGRVFDSGFCVAVGSSNHANPHHKATSCPHDLEGLVADLDEGLAVIAAGEAFGFYVHPWAADTVWVAAGRPEPKGPWIEHYRTTGEQLLMAAA